MNYSRPGSSVPGIFQARILEWVAFPTPGALTDPGLKPVFLASSILAGGFFTVEPPGKPEATLSLAKNTTKLISYEHLESNESL